MSYRLPFVLAALVLTTWAACATSSTDEQPCVGDTDCPIGQICDPVDRLCIDAQIVINNTSNGTPDGGGIPDGGDDTDMNGGTVVDSGRNNSQPDMESSDDGTPDAAVPDMAEPDMGPATCTPACDADEVCQGGQCVSACDPACVAPQICTMNGCTYPDCSAAGDPCDPARPDQNGFACLTYDGEGRCFDFCSEPNGPSDCEATEYCIAVGARNVCVPSECTTHADCGTGSCIQLLNDHFVCASSGGLAVGASCNPNTNGCVQGAYCRATESGGICSHICDPYSATPGCPVGEACAAPLTVRTSMCVPTDTIGNAPFDSCVDPGSACGDGTRCFGEPGDGLCFKYCRHDADDCAGVQFAGESTLCDVYALASQGTLGLCFPACSSSADCAIGYVCQPPGLCRKTCTAGTVTQDCCGGQTPCDYTCSQNGLCE